MTNADACHPLQSRRGLCSEIFGKFLAHGIGFGFKEASFHNWERRLQTDACGAAIHCCRYI